MADTTNESPCATTIIMVRHGDVHNPNDIVYGRLPRFRLSDIGREEAARTAEVLRDLNVTAIYSSPQLRARQTAAAIAAHHPNVKVSINSLLAEVLSSYAGTANKVIAANKYNFYDDPAGEGDETVAQVAERVMGWFRMVLKKHPCGVVIGVSHGDPTMIPRVIYKGLEANSASLRIEEHYPHKASISRFVFRDAAGGDPWKLQPEVTYDDPNRTAREEREAVQKAARGEAAPEAATSPAPDGAETAT